VQAGNWQEKLWAVGGEGGHGAATPDVAMLELHGYLNHKAPEERGHVVAGRGSVPRSRALTRQATHNATVLTLEQQLDVEMGLYFHQPR
jgi:hypothetical protein